MRKAIILTAAVLCAVAVSSCSDETEAMESVNARPAQIISDIYLSESQQVALNAIYDYCVEAYSEELESTNYAGIVNPSNREKIAVVRYCEFRFDPSGDSFIEMDGYEDIEEILWPDGFGNF